MRYIKQLNEGEKMSMVTQLIIVGNMAQQTKQKLNDFLHELDDNFRGLCDASQYSVGTKSFEHDVYLLSFNYFDSDRFYGGMESIIKSEIENSQDHISDINVWIREEHTDRWDQIFG